MDHEGQGMHLFNIVKIMITDHTMIQATNSHDTVDL